MKQLLRDALQTVLKPFDLRIASTKHVYSDVDAAVMVDVQACKPFTMTSMERLLVLDEAADYVTRQRIDGAIVECGVWRGGSSMMMAKSLMRRGDQSREVYLYDTYEGMSEPTADDVSLHGSAAEKKYDSTIKDGHSDWCYASIEDVTSNMKSTGYDAAKPFRERQAEDTIPATVPEKIAILRLDTDWYESTKHEMEQLYPRLVPGGVLIIDDYGHWQGAKKAIEEYFASHGGRPFMHRIDYTGRSLIKP
ncbi:MAG: TylF/MycF/NovP-related O-methyltransferase [Patescibacteria group bacterium]